MKSYSLLLDDNLMRRVKQYCLDNDKTIKKCIVEAIEDKLKNSKQGRKHQDGV